MGVRHQYHCSCSTMRAVSLVLLGLAVASAAPQNSQRIVGGSVTTITQYPYSAALLYSESGTVFSQTCGGTIINNRSILTSAGCFIYSRYANWRVRVGSTFANSGGVVHTTTVLIMHPNYTIRSPDYDVAILRVASAISFNNNVLAGQIAGTNYNLADNQVVWAIGWGNIVTGGPRSEELRHVQIWTVNQAICRQRYALAGFTITDNMLCAGWLDVGGRDQCRGDAGSPLLHNNVVVGVCSWGRSCGSDFYPAVNTRVPRFTTWIQANA